MSTEDDRWLVRVDAPMGHEIVNAFPTEASAMFFAVCCADCDPEHTYEVVEADWSKQERGA